MADSSWLQSLEVLAAAYPAIPGLWKKVQGKPIAREIIRECYQQRLGRIPGRCAVLVFHEDHVEDIHFPSPSDLSDYLHAAQQSHDPQCRLWLLEDLGSEWLEILGPRLHIDPLVLGEQVNTFNFLGMQWL